MNKTQVAVVSGVVGFGLGGATVYFTVSRPRIEAMREEISDKAFAQVEEIRKNYADQNRELRKRLNDKVVDEIIDDTEDKHEEIVAKEIIDDSGYTLVNSHALQDSVAHPTDEDDSEIEEVPEEYLVKEPSEPKLGIVIVSEEEFLANEDGYESSHMDWFPVEEILADDANIPVENEERLIGPGLDALKSNDVVHIINHDMQIRVEVTRSLETYQERVYGIGKEADPRYRVD